MHVRDNLSKKSNQFLENLNIYLFTKGKNFKEINAIVEELETHLMEAERQGKPIEKIVGSSPEEYMEMISKEMSVDYSSWMKYALIIIIGSFIFRIFMDSLDGPLSYSILEIVGSIMISILFICLILVTFKWIAKKEMSQGKLFFVLTPVMWLPLAMFFGLIWLNRTFETTIIHFGVTGSWLVVSLASIFIIGVTLWARTWVLVIILSLLLLPELFLSFTSLSTKTQLIASTLITYSGIFLYLWLAWKQEKPQ